MEPTYALPGAVALLTWFVAAALYTLGWYRKKHSLDRLGSGLVLAGVATALSGVAWLIWDVSHALAWVRSSLATGLAVSVLVIYLALARGRIESLSALAVLLLAIPLQAYAVGRLWWGVEAIPHPIPLPTWMQFRVLTGLVGYGSLGIGAVMIGLSAVLSRATDKLNDERLETTWAGLASLEWPIFRLAVVALSISLAAGLYRSWWGLGQIMADGVPSAMICWLMLAAGTLGMNQDTIPRRTARAFVVLACAAGIVATLAMAAPRPGS